MIRAGVRNVSARTFGVISNFFDRIQVCRYTAINELISEDVTDSITQETPSYGAAYAPGLSLLARRRISKQIEMMNARSDFVHSRFCL